tara:strand:+ start:290 stop:412 length:123 start_codon:yes stop_codon:yes gene_type:complete
MIILMHLDVLRVVDKKVKNLLLREKVIILHLGVRITLLVE